MTQNQKILRYMKQYGSITPLDAMREFSCMRLAARVSDLRRMGIRIKTRKIASLNQYGETVHFAKYTLEGANEQ